MGFLLPTVGCGVSLILGQFLLHLLGNFFFVSTQQTTINTNYMMLGYRRCCWMTSLLNLFCSVSGKK